MDWSDLKALVDGWISAPVRRPFNAPIAAAVGAQPVLAGKAFAPEASYFSVRLVEMCLAERRRYFAEFLPLGVCLSEFTFDDQRRRRPLILSNELIEGQLAGKADSAGYVEYTNMYAVRRAPVKPDNLELFVGLFRVPHNDVAKQALQLAADVTSLTGAGAPFAAGLTIASKIYDRIAGLFQLDTVQARLGFVDGNALTTSGYRLVAAPSVAAMDADRFEVRDGKLFLDGQRASGFDYCLIALECTDTLLPDGETNINALTELAFHKRWKEASRLVMLKKADEAEAQMSQLRAEVVASPELTEADRLLAIGAYETSFEKYWAKVAPPAGTNASRGARSGTPANMLSQAAQKRKAAQPEIGTVLNEMSIRLRTLASDTPDDPERLFALEVGALRKAIPRPDGIAGPAFAASVADAIGSALTL